MNARTRSGVVAVLVWTSTCWWTSSIRANPVLYSTSGTVTIADEPDHQLQGVNGVAPVPDATGQFALGNIPINAVDPFSGPAAPVVSDTPFDIHVNFDNNLPSLELKGVLNPGMFVGSNGFLTSDYEGQVTSVVSSNPLLDAGLPVPFAAAVSDPNVLMLHMYPWDWGVSALQVTVSSHEFETVPEPGTLLLFGLIAVYGVRHARANRRR